MSKTAQEALKVARDALQQVGNYCSDFYANAKVRGAEAAHTRAHEMAQLAETALAATASIERPEVASVDTREFRFLLHRSTPVSLIHYINTHCAQQVAAAVFDPQRHLKDAEEIIQRMMKERDELRAQLEGHADTCAELTTNSKLIAELRGEVIGLRAQLAHAKIEQDRYATKIEAMRKESAQLAERIEPGDPVAEVRDGGLSGPAIAPLVLWDRLPDGMKLYAAQPSAQPAPDGARKIELYDLTLGAAKRAGFETVGEAINAAKRAQPAPGAAAELIAAFESMLNGCRDQSFIDYESGDGENVGRRIEAARAAYHGAQPAPHAAVINYGTMPVGDERAAFEVWVASSEGGRHTGSLKRMDVSGSYMKAGDYFNDDVQALWRAWQARATLHRPAAIVPDGMGLYSGPQPGAQPAPTISTSDHAGAPDTGIAA